MSCMCVSQLAAFVKSLQNLPLNALGSLLPAELPQLSQISSLSSGTATATAVASAQAQAQLRAAIKLGLPPFPLSPPELGKLEAAAFVAGTTGTNPLSANASLSLRQMALSINAHLPSPLQQMSGLLQPLSEPLLKLLAVLQTVDATQAAFGVNLAMPGAMPQLSASLSARAKLAGAAKLDLQAAMNLGSYARLMRATAALGFNLAQPPAAARFSAALRANAAAPPLPPLALPTPELNSMANLLTALRPLQKSVLGIKMQLPKAPQLLAAAISTLIDNLSEPLSLSADALASVSETAALGSQCNALPSALKLGADLQAMARLHVRGLPLDLLPDLGDLAVAARLGEATGIRLWATSPCSRCQFL